MKKIALFSFVLILSFSSYSQSKKMIELLKSIEGQWQTDENNNLFYQEIIEAPGLNKTALFARVCSYAGTKMNQPVVETYPDQFIIAKRHLIQKIHVGIMEYSNLLIQIKFECKDEKVRITLTAEHIFEYVGNNKKPYITSFSKIYPINQDSKLEKNKEAKWFYNSHIICQQKLEEINNYIKGPKKEEW